MGLFSYFVDILPDPPPGKKDYYGVVRPHKRNIYGLPWKDHERGYLMQLDRYKEARERYYNDHGHY